MSSSTFTYTNPCPSSNSSRMLFLISVKVYSFVKNCVLSIPIDLSVSIVWTLFVTIVGLLGSLSIFVFTYNFSISFPSDVINETLSISFTKFTWDSGLYSIPKFTFSIEKSLWWICSFIIFSKS